MRICESANGNDVTLPSECSTMTNQYTEPVRSHLMYARSIFAYICGRKIMHDVAYVYDYSGKRLLYTGAHLAVNANPVVHEMHARHQPCDVHM